MGVKTVFGLPGGENVEILNAIREAGLEFVLVRNESSACFMADVYARLTGSPGVALTTLGPGATNATAGLAHCYLDRAPVLLITAQTDAHLIGTHTHQVIDLQALFQPITKFTAEIQADNAVSVIRYGLSQLQSGRPGPVHFGINNRIAQQQISIPTTSPMLKQSNKLSTETVDAITQILHGKKRPVIVAGLGLEPTAPYQALQTLAETIHAPVIDTPKSKGVLSARHPLFVGTIGLTRTDPAYDILDDADCIVALGFDVVELVKPWHQSQPLIWIAEWENQDPRIPCVVDYVSDVSDMLDALCNSLELSTDDDWGAERVRMFRERYTVTDLPTPMTDRMLPQDVLGAVRDNTPDDIIITTDVGSHKIFTALNWQAYSPNSYFVSNGISAMGFGVVGAIVAAHVTQKPAVCITGDAGMAMVIGELALLIGMQLPVVIIIMNDEALDLIRSAQHRRNRPTFGTEFINPNFASIVNAYDGLNFEQVRSRAECESAVATAIKRNSPTVIEAMIDPIGYPTTVKR